MLDAIIAASPEGEGEQQANGDGDGGNGDGGNGGNGSAGIVDRVWVIMFWVWGLGCCDW